MSMKKERKIMKGAPKTSGPPRDPSEEPEVRDKIERPHAHFEQASEVVVDPALALDEKAKALASMEQDANQLATASAEGMGGGEDNRLQDVLDAKNSLQLPPADLAITAAIQLFRGKLPQAEGTEAFAIISHAIDAIEDARKAIDQLPAHAVVEGKKEESGTGGRR